MTILEKTTKFIQQGGNLIGSAQQSMQKMVDEVSLAGSTRSLKPEIDAVNAALEAFRAVYEQVHADRYAKK